MKNWHKIANFQNFQKSLLNFVPLYGVVIWCKFQLILTKIEGADTFGVNYLKMSILSSFVSDPIKIASFKMQYILNEI